MESLILKGLLAGFKVSLVCFSFFLFFACVKLIKNKIKNVVPLEIML